MNDFLEIVGVLTLCVFGGAALFCGVWLVITVIETKQRLERHWKDQYTNGNVMSDRIWTEHHRVSAIEAELIKHNTDIHNLTAKMTDRDKLGTQFLADLQSLQHQMDAHRKYRHSGNEAKEQEPSSRI